MSADIELLRLAAKAASLRLWKIGDAWRDSAMGTGILLESGRYVWNPLADDGDALRLAIELGLKIDIGRGGVYMEECGVRVHGYESRRELAAEPATDNGASLQAATRRAIVCAAARIGRVMP